MKHTIITLLFFVLTGQMAFAQLPEREVRSEDKEEARAKIKALRKAYILDKIDLTKKESNEFWPIYVSYKEEERTLVRALKNQRRNIKEMTDTEAEAFVEDILEVEQKRLDLKRKYYAKMKTVIPTKKILRLERAERSFRSEVMKRMKGHRGKHGNGASHHKKERSSDE